MRYDDYRQLKLELEHIQNDLKPSFFKAFLQVGLDACFVRNNSSFCQDLRDQYDYQVRNMLKSYRLDEISVHKKFDEIWTSIWQKYEDPSVSDKAFKFLITTLSIFGTAKQAYDAKQVIQDSIEQYFEKTKEYCLSEVLKFVDDND